MPQLPDNLAPLLEAAAYPHPVRNLRLVETHISWVVLTGDYAYKLKKPVRYAFVDLRSARHRAFLCEEELRLNRRFSPELYLEVVDIVARGGTVAVGGEGQVIERAVRMRQFDTGDELDRLLAAGAVEPAELETFGRELADIHRDLPRAGEDSAAGRPEGLVAILRENLEECREAAAAIGTAKCLAALAPVFRELIDASVERLEQRWRAGRMRECHGDLHAGNVVRYGGRLRAFDCLEFDAAFRWIDVADELAFLVMDLEAADRPRHAWAFREAWLKRSGDYGACEVLRAWVVHRALVRAKVAALTAAGEVPDARRDAAVAEHKRYLACAGRNLAPRRPRLILMHGLSGSGKSWVAARLAPRLDAVWLRSDVERKRLAGLGEHQRSGSGPGSGLYTAEATVKTYERLRNLAGQILSGSYTTLVDATFQERSERQRFLSLAARCDAKAVLIRCRAPRHVLVERLRQRQAQESDASEAGVGVLERQERRIEPVGEEEGFEILDLDTTRPDTIERVCARLGEDSAER